MELLRRHYLNVVCESDGQTTLRRLCPTCKFSFTAKPCAFKSLWILYYRSQKSVSGNMRSAAVYFFKVENGSIFLKQPSFDPL